MTQVFTELDPFLAWARDRARALATEVELCDLDDLAPDWIFTRVGDKIKELAHRLRLYFQVGGVRVKRAVGREVSFWFQAMIFGDGNGYVALLTRFGTTMMGETEYELLVRMRAEPGNAGIILPGGTNPDLVEGADSEETAQVPVNTRVLIGPGVQFSQGNLENHRRALRGELDAKGVPIKPVPFASLALPELPVWAKDAEWVQAAEDGGRFFEKVNNYGRIFTPFSMQDELEREIQSTGQPEDFAWIRLSVLRQVFRYRDGTIVNGHLRAVSSLLL